MRLIRASRRDDAAPRRFEGQRARFATPESRRDDRHKFEHPVFIAADEPRTGLNEDKLLRGTAMGGQAGGKQRLCGRRCRISPRVEAGGGTRSDDATALAMDTWRAAPAAA